MLLRGVAQDHSHDDVVTLCKSHILVGEVVVGLSERRGDYLHGAMAEPKTKESLGRFVKEWVLRSGQTLNLWHDVK